MNKGNMKLSNILFAAFIAILLLGLIFQEIADASTEQQILIDKARITFQSFMNDENMSWFHENLYQAKGLLIAPSVLKGGFFIGGSGGQGVLLVKDEKTGTWSQPGFYTIGSITFGLQIGGEASELIMMVRSQKGIDKLLTTSFELGGDTSVAAGPVGIGAKGTVTTDIVSFARTKGAYAGLNFEGAVIKTRDNWNQAYYGKPITPLDIFVNHTVSNPGTIELRKEIAKAANAAQKKQVSIAEEYYIVRSGDTLSKIGQRYSISVDELRRLNNLGENDLIYPGQKLLVNK